VDDWVKFTAALPDKEFNIFWENEPWPDNIERLSDDYNELIAMVKTLRIATPNQFQKLLPSDEEMKKFPKASFHR